VRLRQRVRVELPNVHDRIALALESRLMGELLMLNKVLIVTLLSCFVTLE
jgi:hypothetical protein